MSDLTFLLNIDANTVGIKKVQKAFKQLEQETAGLQGAFKGLSKIIDTSSTRSIDKNGKVTKKSIIVWRNLEKQIHRTTLSFNESGKHIGTTTGRIDVANKATVTMGQNMARLAKRAALTIPVWLLLRGALTGIISSIREGMQYWMELDAQIEKAKGTMTGYVGNIEDAVGKVKAALIELSNLTGTSMEEGAKAFYRFSTVGIPYEEAIAGMEAATKGAMVMFGDADKQASILARVINQLGDNFDASVSNTERYNLAMAQQVKLWKSNAFEADGMAESLMKFLPTADQMNIKVEETIALLATLNSASMVAGRGGRLLKTGLNKFVLNISEVASSLGLFIDKSESVFETFMRVLKKIKELNDAAGKGVPLEARAAMSDLFGGARGGEVISALIGLYDKLQVNLESLMGAHDNGASTMREFAEDVDRVSKSLYIQGQKIKELKARIPMLFLQGVLGGEEFADTLAKLVVLLQDISDNAYKAGKAFRELAKVWKFLQDITGVTATRKWTNNTREKAEKQLDDLIKRMSDKGVTMKSTTINMVSKMAAASTSTAKPVEDVSSGGVGGALADYYDSLKGKATGYLDILSKIQQNVSARILGLKEEEQALDVIGGKESIKLAMKSRELELIREVLKGLSDEETAMLRLKEYMTLYVNLQNSLAAQSEGKLKKLTIEEAMTMALNEDWKALNGTTLQNAWNIEKSTEAMKLLTTLTKAQVKAEQERLKYLEKIVTLQQQRTYMNMAAQGETGPQIANRKLDDFVNPFLEENDKIAKKHWWEFGKGTQLVSERTAKLMILNGQYAELSKLLGENIFKETDWAAAQQISNDIQDAMNKEAKEYLQILNAISDAKSSTVYMKMEMEGASGTEIARQTLEDTLTPLLEKNKELVKAKAEGVRLMSMESAVAMSLNGQITELGRLLGNNVMTREKALKIITASQKVIGETIKSEKENREAKKDMEIQLQELEYMDMKLQGYSEEAIAIQKLKNYMSEFVDKHREAVAKSGDMTTLLSEEEILSMAINRQWDKMISALGQGVIGWKEISKAQQLSLELDRVKLNLLDAQASRVRSMVASYANADEMTRTEMSDAMSASKQMTPEQMAEKFANDPYFQKLFLEYERFFDPDKYQKTLDILGQQLTQLGKINTYYDKIAAHNLDPTDANSANPPQRKYPDRSGGPAIPPASSGENPVGNLTTATSIDIQQCIMEVQAVHSMFITNAQISIAAMSNSVAIKNIDIKVDATSAVTDELVDEISTQIKDGLVNDDGFQRAFFSRAKKNNLP